MGAAGGGVQGGRGAVGYIGHWLWVWTPLVCGRPILLSPPQEPRVWPGDQTALGPERGGGPHTTPTSSRALLEPWTSRGHGGPSLAPRVPPGRWLSPGSAQSLCTHVMSVADGLAGPTQHPQVARHWVN